jgi:creatinine amidohydrolase
MTLAHLTWPEVEALDREIVVVIPTGSLEQHGPHLPLFTDTILSTSVAEAVEKLAPELMLVTPPVWLGASGHHLAFPGSLSASFGTYIGAVQDIVESLIPHGFRKFYLLNGHGGNTEPNGIALRELKAEYPNCVFAHKGYFQCIPPELTASVMEGPLKEIKHACEAEASLMMHLRPELVRMDKLRDDGLLPEPPVQGAVLHFDEMTEQGSFGYATLATSVKGERLFKAAVEGVLQQIRYFAEGFVLRGIQPKG